MTDRMKNGECCPYNGLNGLHSPWCHKLRKPDPAPKPHNAKNPPAPVKGAGGHK